MSLKDEWINSTENPKWSVPNTPPWERLLEPGIIFNILGYTLLCQFLAAAVKQWMWNSFKGFKQYRLRNLTICLFHSFVCGSWMLAFFVTHLDVVFVDPVFYYRPWMRQIIAFSVGYFIHDTVDMLKYEFSRWTLELLAHHAATSFVMSVAIVGERFTVYAYWSLLMEVNSVFLHLRTIFQISELRAENPMLFRLIRMCNLLTFVIFRFGVQWWQIDYCIRNSEHFHYFYYCCGVYGAAFFVVINVLLFFRILSADGYLGEFGRRHAAIQRDDQKKEE